MEETLSVEERLLKQVKKKKRKKRNRKIIRYVFCLFVIVLSVFYLMSDMSKVKALTVQNNRYYSDNQILEKAGLNYDSNYVLTFSWWVNYQLEKDPLIHDAKLKKDLYGGFTISVEEEKVIGYLAQNTSSLLIQGVGLVEDENVNINSVPRIGDFTFDQLSELDKAFEKVDASILELISEILPHSETYNENMVMLIMKDGNRVTCGYDGIYLINSYKKILPQLEGTHVCLFMDEFNGSIIKQNTDCVQKNSSKSE
ncbi:MAG: cell division protein FtsQ/DivIB [Traorella sp.]